MAQMYQSTRRRAETASAVRKAQKAKGPSLQQLQGGAMPTQEQLGRQVELPEAIRSKMESSFGMDFSAVRLYESPMVEQAGAEAVAMGNRIGFAPGTMDFSSSAGQALLGHELSHVVSQARGEAMGSGFLQDSALEARADREGAMAAAGESVYSGPVTPLSSGSPALAAAGPMQAKKSKKEEEAPLQAQAPAPTMAPAPPNPIQQFSNQTDLDQRPGDFNAYHQAQLANSQQWLDSLTDEERNGVIRYSSNDYEQINGQLRGYPELKKPGYFESLFNPQKKAARKAYKDREKTIKNTSAAIDKSRLTEDTVLHRGAKDNFIRFLLKNQMGIDAKALGEMGINKQSVDDLTPMELQQVMMAKAGSGELENKAFSDPGFTSTSIDKRVASGFATRDGHMMEIHAPKGTPAAYIEKISHYTDEKEMLLDKNQKWRIRAVESLAGQQRPGGRSPRDVFSQSSMKLILELINEEKKGKRR